MLGNIGWSGLILVLVALLLVFGPSKLPEIGKAFGRGLREFKDATKGIIEDDNQGARSGGSQNVQTATAVKVEPIELKHEEETAETSTVVEK